MGGLFEESWSALQARSDHDKNDKRDNAWKIFQKEIAKGGLSSFPTFIRELEKGSGRTYVGVMSLFRSSTPGTKRDVTPTVTRVTVVPPKPNTQVPAKTAITTTFSKFEEVWSAWPSNYAFPERTASAQEAYEEACSTYGEQAVVECAKKYIKSAKNLDTPKHFRTWATKDLPIWMEERKKKTPPPETPEEAAALMKAYWDWVNRF